MQKGRLLIVGDSHSVYIFSGVAEAKIYHIPGVTMHRAARDGIGSVIPAECRPRQGDYIVLSLGEIDSRAQLPKHAKANKTSVIEEAESLCNRFEASLNDFRKTCPAQLALCCITPFNPYTLSYDFYTNPEDAVADAKSIRAHINNRLRNMGVPFLDVRPHFSNPDGSLVPSKSDGHLHLDARISAPMLDELYAAFGVLFTPMDPPWPTVFQRAEIPVKLMRRKVRSDLLRSFRQFLLLLPGFSAAKSVFDRFAKSPPISRS
jgi:hypothetical protein